MMTNQRHRAEERQNAIILKTSGRQLSNSYIMGCPFVRGDDPRALGSGLSYVQVDKHSMTTL